MRSSHPLFFVLGLALTSCAGSYYNSNPDVVEETYVHRYGVEVPQERWSESGQNGKVVSTLKTGVVVTRSYNSGILEGDTVYSFPHSSLTQKVETYSQGNLTKEVAYYISGEPAEQITYNGPNSWTLTSWYAGGAPQSKEEYENQRLVHGEYYNISHQIETQVNDGQGTRTRRDGEGQLVSTDSIQNGELVNSTTYYPTGAPKTITPYRNGIVEGTRRTYLQGGEPNTIEQWTAGQQQGITIAFQNGQKFAEIPYVNGQKDGIEKRFRDGITLVEEITWVKDVKHGPATAYIGDVTKVDWYFQNKPVTKGSFDLMSRPNMP